MAIHAYWALAESRITPPYVGEIRDPFEFRIFFLDPTPPLVLDHMEAALLLHRPRPAAGALVLTRRHGPRARPAADARVVLVVQRVVRHVMPHDEVPPLLARPGQQRVQLH